MTGARVTTGRRHHPGRNREDRHQPVLLDECLDLLGAGPGAVVVDGTVGEGGHAEAILERIGPDGTWIGLDRDERALASAARYLERFGDRVILEQASFADLAALLDARGVGPVDALLLDLGMSSLQLDDPGRGFRFSEAEAEAAPLDMRMDRSTGRTAADLLNESSPETLERWFRELGELPGARRLAHAIVRARREAPLRTNADLLRVVAETGSGRRRRHHPATLVFQALRIAVNDELGALQRLLDDLPDLLRPASGSRPGGRALVIAYHSLEDRAVKRHFRQLERGCVCPPGLPVCVCGQLPTLRRITKRPIRPSESEVRANPRARSARLRVAERLELAERTDGQLAQRAVHGENTR